MAILDRFRGGEEEEEGRGRPPVDEVRRLSADGYSESEITETLRDRGYSYGEINEAVNQAVQEQTTERNAPRQEPRDPGGRGFEPGQGEDPAPPRQEPGQESYAEPPREPEPQVTEEAEDEEDGGQSFGEHSGVTVEVEELIETIVSEHFTDVEDEFNAVYSEIDALEDKMEELEDRVEELEIREDEDQEQVVQKVEEMEEYLAESQSRIGGMEKAFQQVLPSLVENTRELSSLVKEMKEDEQ